MKTRGFPARRHAALALLLLAGCRNNQTVVVPNRVLDRPLDVSLACVMRHTDGTVEVLALNECNGAGVGDCEEEDSAQLIGFVANSEKNEVGMFRRCDLNGMVDLDPEAPGYNLVPVGTLPSRIVQTTDCRVVTANVGSCDFSAIDGTELASYAVGLAPSKAPSALVSNVIPLLSDGTPLGASPGDMIAVPRELSLAGGVEDPAGDGTGSGAACDPARPASVFVTFPTCQLVAEISLGTQRILQSRQFVLDDAGEIQVIDSGPDPSCPIECPRQFDGDLPERPEVEDGGMFPMALALVQPEDGMDAYTDRSVVTFPSLFVGGTGSDEVFEIELLQTPGSEAPLGFAPVDAVRRLRLENAGGISAIRPTPTTQIDDKPYQFLYVIAGDGSTHVVNRDTDGTSLGVECDTQVDPSQSTVRACHPIDPDSQGGQSSRRPFAAGPGIRGSDGSTITDWTFERIDASTDPKAPRAPLSRTGVIGVGVTSFGRVVLSVFSNYDKAPPTITTSLDGRTIDPVGLMNVEIRPHMLWPVTEPESGEPSILPLVDDSPPDRVLPTSDNITEVLAPAIRRIDRAYFADGSDDFSDEQDQIWRALGNLDNVDKLGDFEGEALYEENVPRVAVRDYRQWRGGQAWSVEYEPAVPGTESTTGRILCQNTVDGADSGFGPGTCHAGPVDDVPDIQLVDEGATFCDEGVLPGDKFVLFGCADDDTCGTGRRCLRDPTASGSATGICVAETAYESNLEALRIACAPFVSDPCGQPRREYTITSATQTGLTFVPSDIPATTFLTEDGDPCPVPTGPDNLRPGSDGTDSTALCVAVEPVVPGQTVEDDRVFTECEARLTCAGIEQPAGGCTENADCAGGADGASYVCFDGLCRTPCEGGSFNCRQTPLPGPGCFGEFVRYAVTLRESFGVAVEPAARFMTDRVITDPVTGQCREDTTISTLLSSRIPLGVDEATTFELIPDCANPDEATPSDPNPCRIQQIRGSSIESSSSLYHRLSYEAQPIEAIRYSNPFGTLVIDLVSPLDLAAPNELPGKSFSDCFASYRRARIPRGYKESFNTPGTTGYQAYNDPIVVGSTPLTYPVRVVAAPEVGAVFAVDAGGRGGAAGVRGQVVRIQIVEGAIRGDEDFRVR